MGLGKRGGGGLPAYTKVEVVQPETEWGRDSRIVHEDLYNALIGVAALVRAGHEGGVETLVDYKEAKAYITEKLDAMIELMEA